MSLGVLGIKKRNLPMAQVKQPTLLKTRMGRQLELSKNILVSAKLVVFERNKSSVLLRGGKFYPVAGCFFFLTRSAGGFTPWRV